MIVAFWSVYALEMFKLAFNTAANTGVVVFR